MAGSTLPLRTTRTPSTTPKAKCGRNWKTFI
jgi:hypothetical protein